MMSMSNWWTLGDNHGASNVIHAATLWALRKTQNDICFFQSCCLVWYAGFVEKNSFNSFPMGDAIPWSCQGTTGGGNIENGTTGSRPSLANVARSRLKLARCSGVPLVSAPAFL